MKIKAFTAVLVAAAFAFASCGSSEKSAENAPEAAQQELAQDDPAPADPQVAPEENMMVVYDFNATWCVPCKKFAPAFELAAETFAGKAKFVSVDIDEQPDLAAKYNIESVPTVVIIRPDGKEVRYIGTGDLLPADKFLKIVQDNL